MKEALKEFIQSLNKSGTGVRFFEMPTGSGKTYGAIQFMHDFILHSEDFGIKRIMYLTNIKDNLQKTYSDLEKSFGEDKEPFCANVLKLTANIDCIIEKILFVDVDDEITRLPSFQALKSSVYLLKQLESLEDTTPDSLENYKKTILSKAEKSFRNDLEKLIGKWVNCPKEVQKINNINKKFPWLINLYPAILTSQRKVLFITTDKFHSGNNPIVTKSYKFVSHSIVNDALVIIDESDKAKMHLLNHQIQNATDYQLDLLQVVCSIYKSFVQDEKPEELFIQLNAEDKEKTTLRAFEKTRDVFEETFINHNLKYQFKIADGIETKNFFIFHDFDPMTISSSKEAKSIYIRKDDKKKQNLITKEKRNYTDRLGLLIGALVGAVNYFVRFVNIAADNYMNARNKDLPLDEQLEYEDAISTVLSVFGLEQGSLETLKRIAINRHRLSNRKVQEVTDNTYGYDLYEEGYQLYSFLNDNSHDLNTKIMMSFLDDTPEKFLKTLASNTMVACISATAFADTVLNNFNLSYLKDCLGDSMSSLPKETVARLKKKYIERREKSNVDIYVDPIDVKFDKLPECFSNADNEKEQFEAILNSYPDGPRKGSDSLFNKKRIVKIAIAIKSFLLNKNGRVMLVLAPKLLRQSGSDDIYNEEVIQKIIKIVLKKKTEASKITVLTLSSKNSKVFKAKYEAAINAGQKVIIFSSYSSAGTGQNLQYSLIDDKGSDQEVDIDSIYLEKPRYILSIPERNMTEAQLSGLIYENLSLATNHEKTFREAKGFIRKAYQVKEQDDNDLETTFTGYQNYECDSVNNAGVVIIKQAVGRISRTDDKNTIIKEKHIYIDQEIYNSFSFEGEENKFNTLEFQEVVKKATAPVRNNPVVDTDMVYAINMCDMAKKAIRSLLPENKEKWIESDAIKYKKIRLFLLRHPTISKEELDKNPEMRTFYLRAPQGTKIRSYWFKRIDEGDEYRIEKISYDKFFGGIEASPSYVKLEKFVRLPEVKKYFNQPENGFATSFEPNDYIALPNVLDDIYRGVLGEAVGFAIFQNRLGIQLEEIKDLSKFEKFDYCLKNDKDIYIDFKHWSHRLDKMDDKEFKKISEKMQAVGAKAVLVVNVLANSENKVYTNKNYPNIYIIPYLLVPAIFGSMFDEKRCNAVKKLMEDLLK